MNKKIFLSVLFLTFCLFATAQSQTSTHVVQRGETLESIAEYYKVSVDDINKANPNADGMVYVGMKLVIPVRSESAAVTDTVKIFSKTQTNQYEVTGGNNKTVSNNSFYYGSGASFSFLYQSEIELYGLHMEFGADLFRLNVGFIGDFKFGEKETNAMTGWIGAGVGRKLVFGDKFLIQGQIYPYIGLTQTHIPKIVEIGQDAKDKEEFTYGAYADLSAGIKLWNTSKGNSTFLHVGYAVMAGEFETKGLIKNGCLMVGLTTIWK